jgi:AcrR family transcriptional regulator
MSTNPSNQRGPIEHTRREQIIAAANDHFRHYGYNKTTVADLAKAIGLSTAYIYKFFESKQAIGEASCNLCLSEIADVLQRVADEDKPASERLKRIFLEVSRQAAELFFQNRKMHDIVAAALSEHWSSVDRHNDSMLAVVRQVLVDGRKNGEFERKTPLDETTRAILLAMEPIKNPIFLEQRLDSLEADAAAMANLVLRSLSP